MSEGFGGLAGAAAAELHLKMSKKIAQLTKVIFHLNTRNEDFQGEVAHARHAHARELAQLSQDAAAKLRLLHEQLHAQTSAAQLAERRAGSEHQALQQEVAQLQLKARAAQSAAEQTFRQRVAQLEAQVDASQRAFSERAEQLVRMAETQQQAAALAASSALAVARSAHAAELAELRAEKHDEATQLVTASNAKYNEMLAEQLRAQDALRDAGAANAAALELRLARATSDFEAQAAAAERAAREQFDQMKHQLVGRMETVLADAEQLRGREAALRQEKETLAQQRSELQRQLQQLELQVAKARQEALSVRKDADASVQRQQELLAAGSDKIDELAQELEALKKALQTRDQALRQAQKDLEAAQLETLEHSASLSEKDARLRQQLQERELQLASAQAQQQQRALAETALQKRVQALEAQGEAASKELVDVRAKLAACGLQHAQQQKAQEAALAALRAAGDERDRRAQELRGQHEGERAELIAAHATAVQQLQVEAEAKLQALESQQARSSRESLERSVAQLKSEHAKAASDARAAADAAQQALTHESARLAAQLRTLQGEAATRETELAGLRAKAAELAVQLALEQEKLARALGDKDAQLRASDKSRREKEDALLQQIRELGGQREAATKKLAAEKQQLQLQHSQTLAALAREHESKLKKLQGEWEAQAQLQLSVQAAQLTEHYELLLATANGDVLALQTRVEHEAREARDAQRALLESRLLDHEDHRGALLQLLARADAERRRAEQQAQLQTRAALEQHADELEKLGERLRTEQQQLQADASRRLAQLGATHVAELEQCDAQHALATLELQRSLEAKRQSEAVAMHEEHAQMTRELAARKDRERAEALREAQARHDAAADALRSQAELLQSSLAQMRLELEAGACESKRLGGALAARTVEMADKLAARERASREQVETLKRAAKQDMDRLLEENLAETALLSEQFEAARRLMTDKVALLQQAVGDWEARHARRESRPEDVSRIAELERLVAEKAALVRQTLDEMAFFKRELLNREEMYNKTFARAPNVGVLNVLKPHVQLQAQLQAGLGPGAAPQTKRKTKPAHGPEAQAGELQRRSSERAVSSSGGGGGGGASVKKSLPPLQNNQVAM